MVESMLRNLNLRTGLFSFHVVKWNERIRINGAEISDEMLAKYYWDIRNELRDKVTAQLHLLYNFLLDFIFVCGFSTSSNRSHISCN